MLRSRPAIKFFFFDRGREVNEVARDKVAMLPIFKRLAEYGRGEEAAFPVVAEVTGRNEI
jgi:hypothetical protein